MGRLTSSRQNPTRLRIRVAQLRFALIYPLFSRVLWVALAGLLTATCAFASSGDQSGSAQDLTQLSLEDLMNVTVTSVSKKSEPVSEAPAAVYVINGEEIRRSGATCIPEALRLVPGMQVAQIDANKWAVTARGFNGMFANKLLVLIDGRCVYTPAFSGVYWDVQDVVMESIDRIEVIRGPGATMWGANAVNGVINIITKRSSETSGISGGLSTGNRERNNAVIQYGGFVSENLSYRVNVKQFQVEPWKKADRDTAQDNWGRTHGSFRLDWNPSKAYDLTLSGDLYDGKADTKNALPIMVFPYLNIVTVRTAVSGGNILARGSHPLSDHSTITLQGYVDHTQRVDLTGGETRNTYDLEYQQDYRNSGTRQVELVWGAGYRVSTDDMINTPYYSFSPSKQSTGLLNVFGQFGVDVVKERLTITVGSKIEHNSFTNFEIQPSMRFLWSPNKHNSLWGAVSRAVRTPSRGERDGTIWLSVIPPLTTANPGPLTLLINYVGGDALQNEELTSQELGYRAQPSKDWWMDVALFYNRYEGIFTAIQGEPILSTESLTLPIHSANKQNARTYGGEIAVDWQPNTKFRAKGSYTYFFGNISADPGTVLFQASYGVLSTPKHQVGLFLMTRPTTRMTVDLFGRYVDRLQGLNVDGYMSLDGRIGLSLNHKLELSLTGKNILEKSHVEFQPEIFALPASIGRRLDISLNWRI
jgi:iron complex outermembrane recepter protein